jgi:hypothetical protein
MKNLPKNKSCIGCIAGMAYYIFQKSLRSIEEFRKNPHLKIPPKSPPTKFPKPLYIQKSNFYLKGIFPPNSAHSAQPACPLPRPWPADRPKPSNPPLRPTSPATPPSLPDDRVPLAFVLLQSSRAPPHPGCAAAAPEPAWPPPPPTPPV